MSPGYFTQRLEPGNQCAGSSSTLRKVLSFYNRPTGFQVFYSADIPGILQNMLPPTSILKI